MPHEPHEPHQLHPDAHDPSAAGGKSAPTRSACDVLNNHLALAKAHRFEEDLARNFADDTLLLTSFGVFRGIEGLRQKVRLLEEHLPNGRYEYKQILCEGEMGFLEWSGEGSGGERVDDGADSYLIRDDRIRVMTIHYTVQPPWG